MLCADAPQWVRTPTGANASVHAPFTLRLQANLSLCVDSATLSTQCGWQRQCGAVLWQCAAAGAVPPPAHTWTYNEDGALSNMRDPGFVGSNGGATSGGVHCLKSVTPSSPFPVLDKCSHATDKRYAASVTWTLNSDGKIASKACHV